MDTCLYCEYYNSRTGKCGVTGQKKDPDSNCNCKGHTPVDYEDWEH